MTMIALDVGNAATKFKNPEGKGYIVERSSVRTVGTDKFTFGKATKLDTFIYRSGPSPIRTNTPFYIGNNAKHGTQHELVQTGSAAVRKDNAGYIALHIWAIAQHRPTEPVTLTLGLPMQDYGNKALSSAIAANLKGEHTVQIGDTVQTFTVDRVWFRPQPSAAVATLLYDFNGHGQLVPRTSEPDKLRVTLDIGGGTSDWGANNNLETVPNTQGGVEIGTWHIARIVADTLSQEYPLSNLYDLVADTIRNEDAEPYFHFRGEKVLIGNAINEAKKAVAQMISRAFLSSITELKLRQGELVLVGGGGKLFAPSLKSIFEPITTVIVPSNPQLRVVQGLHVLGSIAYNARQK